MGWGRRGSGWPGRGPFSYLPPWQRPGWLYGRGACWWLLNPNLQQTVPATSVVPPTLTKEQETEMLKQHMAALESQLTAIKKRLEELNK